MLRAILNYLFKILKPFFGQYFIIFSDLIRAGILLLFSFPYQKAVKLLAQCFQCHPACLHSNRNTACGFNPAIITKRLFARSVFCLNNFNIRLCEQALFCRLIINQ